MVVSIHRAQHDLIMRLQGVAQEALVVSKLHPSLFPFDGLTHLRWDVCPSDPDRICIV